MLGTLIIAAAAFGGVVLVDGGGCLQQENLELELRSWIGDEPVDANEIRVRLSIDEVPWTLGIEAFARGGEPLWRHEGMVQPADCPALPRLVSRIAEQQFGGVKPWGLDPPPPARKEWVVELAGTAPGDLHFALGAGLGVPLTRRLRWFAHVEGYLGSPVSLGTDRRRGEDGLRYGQFYGALLGGGLSYDLVSGPVVLRARGLVSFGPHVAFGQRFEVPTRTLAPRATTSVQLDVVAAPFLRIGARATVPFVRLAPASSDGSVVVPEPWFRAGLVMGIGAPIGRVAE